MKRIILFLGIIMSVNLFYSQEEEAPIEEKEKPWAIGLDIVYPYYWRGIRLIDNLSPAFQPYASYTIADKLTFGVWATSNLTDKANNYGEVDWYVNYQINDIVSVQVSDYYSPATKSGVVAGNGTISHYFDYDYGAPHVMDGTVFLNFKGIDFQWNTIFYGSDFKDVVVDSNGNATDEKRAFSSYAEIGYAKEFGSTGLTIRPYVGAAVINEAGYYGVDEDGDAGLNFSNVGAKLTWAMPVCEKWQAPIWINYHYNQFGNINSQSSELKHHFISAGISFSY